MTTPELVASVKKNPVLVACATLSLALAVTLYFRSGLIAEANGDLDQKTSEAARYEANLNFAAQLKEQLDQITAANQAIHARLIRASDLGINQQFFYKLESETGVKLLELNQSTRGGGAKNLMPVMFHVTVQGEFAQVLTFLRALNSGAHFSRIADATCSGGRAGSVNLTMSVELLGQP